MKRNKKCKAVYVGAVLSSTLLLQVPVTALAAEAAAEYSLDQVVVTANRVPTKVSEAAANVDVITKEQIAKGHYRNLGEVLRSVNGVIVSGGSFPGAGQYIRLNGDDRVQVMIDGRRIGRPEGTSGRSSIDITTVTSLDNIERIEIVKGGASALYGSDAVGGVVNIITRKGAAEKQAKLNLSTGSWGERNYGLSLQGSENDLSWYFTADQQHRDHVGYKALTSRLPSANPNQSGSTYEWPNSKFDGEGITLRLDKEINKNESVTFNFEHWNEEAGQPSNLRSLNLTTEGAQLSNNFAVTYDFNRQSTQPGYVRVYTNYHNQGFQGIYKSRTQGMQYQTGWQLDEQNKLTAGIDWSQGTVLDNKNSAGVINYEDKTTSDTAVYLQDIFKPNKKMTIIPGIRFDNYSKFGGQATPKLNVNYSMDKTTDFYVSYNRVFKAPTLDDLYYNDSWGGGMGMFGNPDLKPEKGHVISAGINKKLSKETSVKLNYFVSKISDAIDWYTNDGWMHGYVQNVNEETKRGVEFDINHRFSEKYYGELGFSYLKLERDLGQYATGTNSLNPDANPYPRSYHLKAGYQDAKWDILMDAQAVTGRNTTYFVNSDYWIWNVAANYKIAPNTSIWLKGNNLTNAAYELQSTGSTASTIGGLPMPARNFQMGVQYQF